VKTLWSQLKPSDRDYILFGDLDPETDAQLTELYTKMKAHYGNMLLAWTQGMDSRGSGCVNLDTFVDACEKVGFEGNPKKLFRKMQPDATRRFLTLKDFDTQAYQALSRADFRMLSESEDPKADGRGMLEMTFDERQSSGFYWNIRRAWDKASQEEFARACQFNTKDFAIDSVEEFEALCRRNFGSMMGAWRLCLDSDGNGKLTFGEWCAALRRVGDLDGQVRTVVLRPEHARLHGPLVLRARLRRRRCHSPRRAAKANERGIHRAEAQARGRCALRDPRLRLGLGPRPCVRCQIGWEVAEAGVVPERDHAVVLLRLHAPRAVPDDRGL